MVIKALLGAAAALAIATAAQAQVNVQIWTGANGATGGSNATIAAASGFGAPNATTTVGGINFATNNSPGTTIGTWLGNPAGLDAGVAATAMNNTYMLFTGQIALNQGDNIFDITHDDGVQLNIDGIGMIVDHPLPTSPITNQFTATAPSTGVYNFTLSYGECCGGPAVLQWFFNGAPVGGVPEPSTWAMMLLGFAGIGIAMRKRNPAIAQLA